MMVRSKYSIQMAASTNAEKASEMTVGPLAI